MKASAVTKAVYTTLAGTNPDLPYMCFSVRCDHKVAVSEITSS